VLLTANKVLWQASANFLYNPFYGKIAVFNRALMHWESYVQVGGGVDPDPGDPALTRPSTSRSGRSPVKATSPSAPASTSRRLDWVSVNFGVRNFIYQDKLEPGQRGPSTGPAASATSLTSTTRPTPRSNAEKKLAFNVVFFLGVSFYFPTTFQYTTRR
jgi:hypothetical protein